MIDIQELRANPDAVKAAIARKKFSANVDALLQADTERRDAITKAENARAQQKTAQEAMQKLEKGSEAFAETLGEMKQLSADVKALEAEAKALDEAYQTVLFGIPNMPHPSVPTGKGESENVTLHAWAPGPSPEPTANEADIEKAASANANATPHWDIEKFESWVNFPRGVAATGAGFPFYVGNMARLVRSLIGLFLDEANAAGFTEMLPPIVVNAESATATGQLPDKEGQMYHVQNEDFYLIPTAEVPVTNFYRNHIFEASELPMKACAHTPCFRREAGSWGSHVRGLNRLHQFDKVELVKWVHPEHSFDALEDLREHAESILKKLELPYRTLLMCTGDIGFPHAKQYDLEVFAQGQKRWLEVSSCSNFTCFQARRANIRFRAEAEPGGKPGKPSNVHTLNASGLAVPRVLAALLENGLQPCGNIQLPAVLAERMGSDKLV